MAPRIPQSLPTCVLSALTVAAVAASGAGGPVSPGKRAVEQTVRRLPLAFERNVGQTDSRVRYLTRGPGYSLFLTGSEAALALAHDDASGGAATEKEAAGRTSVLRMQLEGANPEPAVSGLQSLPGRVNYLLGSDRSKWRTNVPLYGKVRYEEVYPGVDVAYYGNAGRLEYDFILEPGADPDRIRIRFDGSERPTLEPDGSLLLRTAAGAVRQHPPVVYQEHQGRRVPVPGRYALLASNEGAPSVGFELGAYDRTRELVIDPVLTYSTYLGGTVGGGDPASGDDQIAAVRMDSAGNLYLTGTTTSASFPTTGGTFDRVANGSGDFFVTKVNADGSFVHYSTYLGGSGADQANDLVIDSSGTTYVVGTSSSTDFPMQGAVQNALSGPSDAVVARLRADGSGLLYATYLGGTASEGGASLALDGSANIYVTGATNSTDFPTTPGAHDASANGLFDGYVTKLRPVGIALIYSTYLGGDSQDASNTIAVDGSGNAYVAGSTTSTNFPTLSPLQGTFAGNTTGGVGDGFVTKLGPSGGALTFSTYFGGDGSDRVNDLAIDSSGGVYVVGATSSTNFPLSNAPQATLAGRSDAFVAKLSSLGTSLEFSTYYGGSNDDSAVGLAVDSVGVVHAVGTTASSDFPLSSPLQTALLGISDAFVVKMSVPSFFLYYSTFLGGGGSEIANNVLTTSGGGAWVVGATGSPNFPVVTPLQTDFAGGNLDGFLAKLNPLGAPTSLSATTRSSREIVLNWTDNVSGESGFEIERRTAATPFSRIGSVAANVTTFTDSSGTPATTYFYRVRAVSAEGTSEYSNDASATTLNSPPTAPSALTLTATSPSSVRLVWLDNSNNETGFKIERRSGTGEFVQIGTVVQNITTFNDAGLQPNTSYAYRVIATNVVGDSAPSTEASIVTGSTTPLGLRAITASSSQINLLWTNVDPTWGIQVERADSSGTFNSIALLPPGASSYTDAGLTPNTTYSYRLRAFSEGVISEPSNTATATTNQTLAIASLVLTPNRVRGGRNVRGKVTLTLPAPESGVVVTLESTNTGLATVPQTVTVRAGRTSVGFPITTGRVRRPTTVRIIAAHEGATKTANLRLRRR